MADPAESARPDGSSRHQGPACADDPMEVLLAEVAAADATLEGAAPEEVLGWAYGRFGDATVLTSSFQDCVLVHLAAQVRTPVKVVFLDTGFHFEETLRYVDAVSGLLGIDVSRVSAGLAPTDTPCGAPGCCERRKVEPLVGVLAGREAWITGVKRVDTPERASAATVSYDARKGVVKVNPLASWTEDDVDAYMASHRLPSHPLAALGYRSIGCAPTTQPVAPGQDPREGRWWGTQTECGLHL